MADFSLSRSTCVDATADRVHPLLDDFHEWTRWSPWEHLDPDLHRTYAGADSGVGATYYWKGNSKAGEGRMEMTESTQQRVAVDLQFLKPFKATNVITFVLTPAAGGTDVTWTMTGRRNPVMGLMGKLYFDKAVAKDFDKGLAALKAEAERTDR
jgi:hypothetical protein